MSDDNWFWSILLSLVVTVVLGIAVSVRGINHDDDELYKNAIAQGCSVVKVHGEGHEIICPKFKRVVGVE